ncbi:MAG TPA: hypothetical protein VGN46_18815 [Luteibacter sp.]|jgi:hypothetical protein|uniref:hypothetical protein n=1 Tax=Luteibacter sp. TaxID=1886636 RepID=UPI002F404F93
MDDFNSMLIEQINDQLKRGFDANLRAGDFCVVETRVNGVLSVLPSAAVSDQHKTVFGPGSFASCIAYVNGHLVTRPLSAGDIQTLHVAARAGDADIMEGDHP